MRTSLRTLIVVLTAAAFPFGMLPSVVQADEIDDPFESSIASVVIRNCLNCHNGADPKGGLDLSHRETLLKGGDSGPAVVPGAPEKSYLVERISDGSMPPEGQGNRLAKEAVDGIAVWIRDGAKWPDQRILSPYEFTTEKRAGFDWWSLQPVHKPSVPTVRDQQRVRNPIDAFVVTRLESHGLQLAAEADRATLIRRVKYDLLGLPPTPDEISDFLADESQDAYAKLIDRFLASPHYGERWGRHWLDVVRFGESDGFENDKLRPHAWRYRDYVIDSLNADKPYTEFVREQLAGDALDPFDVDGLIATGFLVAGPWDEVQSVGKSKSERLRTQEEQREELMGTVGQTFLGLTLHCARCHDHKFDPIPQVDYYRMKAVFDGVDHAEGRAPGNQSIFTPREKQQYDQAVKPIRERIATLESQLAELKSLGPSDAKPNVDNAASLQTEGRFASAIDARKGWASTTAKPVFHTPPLTVECWAKVESRSRFNILVAANEKSSGHHWEVYTYANSGELSVYMPGYTPAEIRSGRDITDGQWHYIAMTFDGSEVRLFVDAHLVREATVTAKKTDGPVSELWIGAYPPQKIGCDGIVDEVRISNVVRDIHSMPDGPFAADQQTIGLWHLDAIEGDVFRDFAPGSMPHDAEAVKKQETTFQAQLTKSKAELESHTIPLTYAGVRRQPEPTVLFQRGNVKEPGPQVTPAALSSLRPLSPDLQLPADSPEGERREAFADWVASPKNPLSARVLVNRLWQYHFGVGIVETPSDFGFNGGRPSHPELLDWLAAEFMESGWSIKQMHRTILLSATYRQSSRFNPKAAEFDKENRLLWRFTPQRLDGEIVRDAMLATSGELNPTIGGPSFRPFTVTVFLTNFYHLFDSDKPEFNRRTVYRMNINTGRDPLLDSLDCPAPSITMPKRRSTVTTLQALSLMNDSFVMRQAERFAERLERSSGNSLQDQVERAYQIAFSRSPNAEELKESAVFIAQNDLTTFCWVLLNSSEFLYVR